MKFKWNLKKKQVRDNSCHTPAPLVTQSTTSHESKREPEKKREEAKWRNDSVCMCNHKRDSFFFCVLLFFFVCFVLSRRRVHGAISLLPPPPSMTKGVAIASRRRKDRTYRDTQNLWWEGIMHVAHFGLPFSCHLPIGSFRLRLLMTFHARTTTTTTTTRGHQPRIDDIQNKFFFLKRGKLCY